MSSLRIILFAFLVAVTSCVHTEIPSGNGQSKKPENPFTPFAKKEFYLLEDSHFTKLKNETNVTKHFKENVVPESNQTQNVVPEPYQTKHVVPEPYQAKNVVPPASVSEGLLTRHADGKPKRNIFCYYGSSAYTRSSLGKFWPEHVDPFLCTHLIFAFVDITEDGSSIKPNNKIDLGPQGLYARTVRLKEKNPDLKVLLAVGGWKIGSKPFLPVIASEETWRVWIQNVIVYLREHGFDGFDMDWEFPGWRGSGPEDRHKFTLLMRDLQNAFREEAQTSGKEKLLLTLATASSAFYAEKSYEQAEIHKHLDYMLLMTYNYHGSGWEKQTGHHSPMLPHPTDPEGEQRELNIIWSIEYWLQFGVPREKIILGIPTYGLGWKLTDLPNTGIKAPSDGGNTKGKYTGESGILSHYEICEHIIQDGWKVEWIPEQKVPYAHGGGEWVGFDSPDSLYMKAMTILRMGLGGAFIWSVEMDDFRGHCGGPKYPLLRTVYEVFTKTTSQLANVHSAPAASAPRSSHSHSYALHGHTRAETKAASLTSSAAASTSNHKESSGSVAENQVENQHHSESWKDESSGTGGKGESKGDYPTYYSYDDAPYLDEVDCNRMGLGIHKDPHSCHHFILCMPMTSNTLGPTRMVCPAGTLFDESLKICNHQHEVHCPFED